MTKSERCVMLGPSHDNPKAYLLMSLERKRYFISRDVVAEESSFPFKKAFQICAPISTQQQPVVGEELESEFLDDVQPDNQALFEHYDVPEEAVPPQEDPVQEPVEDLPVAPLPSGYEPVVDPAKLEPVALRDLFTTLEDTLPDPPRTRASMRIASEDPQRTILGTGDKNPAARTSPATFEVGKVYESSHYGQPVQIVKNNDDGDVQVTFPSSGDNKQWTVDKSEIDDIQFDDLALTLDHTTPSPDSAVLSSPLDWIPVAYDGLLVPSCQFTLFDETKFAVRADGSAQRLTQQYGGFTHDSRYHVAFLTSEDLIGKVLAQEVDIPKYHFGLGDHPLRPLCEQAMQKELATLIRRGVFGQGRPPLKDEPVIGTMFVLKAKSDASGLLSQIKARLTVLGNQEKQDSLSYSPVMLLASMRLLLSLHAADLDVHFHALDITAAFVSAKAVRDVTVRLPKGFTPPGHQSTFVYPLLYCLYGTVDSPRAFYLDYFQ